MGGSNDVILMLRVTVSWVYVIVLGIPVDPEVWLLLSAHPWFNPVLSSTYMMKSGSPDAEAGSRSYS